MQTWLQENFAIIISVIVAPTITWFITKRHFQKRELEEQDISNESKSSDLIFKNIERYQKLLTDIESRYEELLEKKNNDIKDLEAKIDGLQEEVGSLKEHIMGLETLMNKK